MQKQELLSGVLHFFNQDSTNVPPELYKAVFQAVNSNTAQSGEVKGAYVQRPEKEIDGILSSNVRSVEKWLQEAVDTGKALLDKLQTVGYAEISTPDAEQIKILVERLERVREGRRGFAVGVDVLMDLAQLNHILVNQAFQHVNFLF